jgi:hypothetical protein
MVAPLPLAAGLGLGFVSYFEQKAIAEKTREWQNAMYAANLSNIYAGQRQEARQIHRAQFERDRARSIQQRENLRQGLQELGLVETSAAARNVGGRVRQIAMEDVLRRTAENRFAIEKKGELDQQAAAAALEIQALNAHNQMLQAYPTPTMDPSLLNSIMGGLSMGAAMGAFG